MQRFIRWEAVAVPIWVIAATSASYVEVGQKVNKGDVLCIIEAMKIMNEIESEASGTIIEIVAEDGQPVEYGEELFVIG